MNVNSSDERELGTTTLMIDLRFRGRKWKDYFFGERSRRSVRKWKRKPVSKEK